MGKTIYDNDAKIEIGEFIRSAVSKTSIFIPDLQRNYVWSPSQIIMLIDSVFLGWPFGSLLTWEVFPQYDENHNLQEGIPYRCFFTKVSRVSQVQPEEATARDMPSNSKGDLMILDGQQRLQSILLAFADNKGMCLYDHDWKLDQKDTSSRSVRRNYDRYSTASLYLNVESYMNQMKSHNYLCSQIDLGKALEWVIIRKDDCSARRTNVGYPLENMQDTQNLYLLLSDLWYLADPAHADLESELMPAIQDCLSKFPEEKLNIYYEKFAQEGQDGKTVLEKNLAKLLARLCEINTSSIRCLKIKKFESRQTGEKLLSEKNEYDDAIVNIFTRLNTAGRSLTREEITFAWLKQGWQRTDKYPKATDFVDQLQQIFAEWRLSNDDIIRAVATIWCIQCQDGSLLRERDLLQSSKIRPMAIFLSEHTEIIEDIAQRIAKILKDVDCNPADSFNATIIAWAYYLVGETWRRNQSIAKTRMEADSERKDLDTQFKHFMSRWFVVPSWGQKWAVNIQIYTEGLAKKLNAAFNSLSEIKAFDSLLQRLKVLEKELLDSASSSAIDNLPLRLSERKVYLYKSRLLVWQRLTETRAKYRDLTFKTADTKSSPELQVDHLIAYAAWEDHVRNLVKTGNLTAEKAMKLFTDKSDEEISRLSARVMPEEICNLAIAFINNIGNCSILNGCYNSSKDKLELGDFMDSMQEFKPDSDGHSKVSKNDWLSEMKINDVFVHPFSKPHSLEEIVNAIKKRETDIYTELKSFVNQDKNYDILY